MSHPVPGHEYGENEYESHSPHKEGGVRPQGKSINYQWKGIKKAASKLKRMVDEPAEKKWFIKHGLPKGIRGSLAPKSAALTKKVGSFERMNAERKRQGYKPKTDRATKGLYDFLDK